MKGLRLFFFLSVGILTSCEIRQRDYVDTKVVAQEIKDRKLKRITEAQIFENAQKYGKKTTDKLIPLQPTCEQSINTNTLQDSILGVVVESVIFRCKNASSMHEKEKQVMEAFAYNAQHKMPITDNLQAFDNGNKYFYNVPLLKSDTLYGMWSVILTKKQIIRNI